MRRILRLSMVLGLLSILSIGLIAEENLLINSYWMNKIKTEFELNESEIYPYKRPNEQWLDFYKRLDGIFVTESVGATPEKLYRLSLEFNTTITDAHQAFVLGRKYLKQPAFLLELFIKTRDWKKVETAFSHYEEHKNSYLKLKSIPLEISLFK